MRNVILLFVIAFSLQINAQELFVITEPASNMPAGSVSVRIANSFMKNAQEAGYNYHTMPVVMYGLHKNLMVDGSLFVSNRNDKMKTEGGSLFAKYRFFSIDDLHSHFRMAVFSRISFNSADIHQEELNLNGHNSGYKIGLIATQLIHKIALSSTFFYTKAGDNTARNPFPEMQSNAALNYSFSFGKLLYPKKYIDFKQTNINGMLEFEGQTLQGNGKSYLDIAPSIQFIINSQANIDIAYIKQIYSTMERSAPNGIYIKFEYTFFNVTN
jgi:hypothetical protein